MRLINVHDFSLCEFDDAQRPRYAILSHRWGNEEVSYQDFFNLRPSIREKEGFQKIVGCCKKAVEHELSFVWIDTCCINSESSAELSESINSMYKWYQDSHVCFAYLADVTTATYKSDLQEASASGSFAQSVWFTRGWTLQELLAPLNLLFFNHDWTFLGSKKDLETPVSLITGIDTNIVSGRSQVYSASVARRFSWAAKRSCLRSEDIAYSLLGLFNVHMPMVYGEGSKAFIRLQEEILKNSRDHTIFAWSRPNDRSVYSGLLASHPRDFERSGNFVPFSGLNSESLLVNTTNIGISLEIISAPPIAYAALNCLEDVDLNRFATIRLAVIDENRKQYVRTTPSVLESKPLRGTPRRIYVTSSMEHVYLEGRRLRYVQPELVRCEGNWCVTSLLVCPTIAAIASDSMLPDIEAQDELVEIPTQNWFKYRYSLPITSNRPAVVIRGCWMERNTSKHSFQLAIGRKDDTRVTVALLPPSWAWDEFSWEDPFFTSNSSTLPFKSGLPHGSKLEVYTNFANGSAQQSNIHWLDLEITCPQPSKPSKIFDLSYDRVNTARIDFLRLFHRLAGKAPT